MKPLRLIAALVAAFLLPATALHAMPLNVVALADRLAVRVEMPQCYGSGTLVGCDRDGVLILTADHVLREPICRPAKVRFRPGGSLHHAWVEDEDQQNDLGLLRVRGRRAVEVAKLATHEPAQGEDLVGVGTPLSVRWYAAFGHAACTADLRGQMVMDFHGYPGASGSGIFDRAGELVGVMVSLYTGTSICFATPLPAVRAFLARNRIGGAR